MHWAGWLVLMAWCSVEFGSWSDVSRRVGLTIVEVETTLYKIIQHILATKAILLGSSCLS